MGSAYHGPNSDCYHCTGCGTHRPCDDCTANCCQENMNDHRRLRRLENTFIDKVYSAKKFIYNKCTSTIIDLKDNYNITILINKDNNNNKNILEQSRDILESMKLKKEQIKKEISNIKEDRDKKNRIQRIRNAHKKKMLSISNKFRKSMNKIEMEYSDFKKQEDKIKEKQKEKKELKIEKDEIENKYSNDFDNFKSEKENKLIEKYEIKKKEIDLKYAYLENIFEPNFEYTEEEKNEKNYYLQNINAIQKFSNIIPNYEIIMKQFGISNYLS